MTSLELDLLAAKGRISALNMVYGAASGHIGGSLSALDIITELYFDVMNVDPENPKCEDRDRFVLSKGHATPALYSVLAMRGYFPMEELKMFRSIKGHLSGHAEMNHVVGVDMSTGSLGQGISTAVGMAIAGKLDKKDYRVYALVGDGECQEGQVWEALMSASHFNLDNFCVTVDMNGLQIDGNVSDVMNTSPMDDKLRAFGYEVFYADGHNFDSLKEAYAGAKAVVGKPSAVLASTHKGHGVSFMSDNAGWHGKAPNKEQYEAAMAELMETLAKVEGK